MENLFKRTGKKIREMKIKKKGKQWKTAMTEELGCVPLSVYCNACHLVCHSVHRNPSLNGVLLEAPMVMLTKAAHTNIERFLWIIEIRIRPIAAKRLGKLMFNSPAMVCL